MTNAWHWPQWTYAILTIICLFIMAGQHGEERTGRHNAILSVLSSAVLAWILHEGGFW